jgi:hypothetical protein
MLQGKIINKVAVILCTVHVLCFQVEFFNNNNKFFHQMQRGGPLESNSFYDSSPLMTFDIKRILYMVCSHPHFVVSDHDLVATLIRIFPCSKCQGGNSFSLLNFVFEVVLEAERGPYQYTYSFVTCIQIWCSSL